MRRTPSHSLWLLVAFALGGLVIPSLHGVWHAGEQAVARAQHAADGHHHHTAADGHDAALVAPCPEPLAVDLQCVRCLGVSVYLPSAASALLARARPARLGATTHARGASAPAGLLSIRGPPEPVA